MPVATTSAISSGAASSARPADSTVPSWPCRSRSATATHRISAVIPATTNEDEHNCRHQASLGTWSCETDTGTPWWVASVPVAAVGTGADTGGGSRAGERHLMPHAAGDVEAVALVLPGGAVRGVGVKRMPVVG